MHTSGSSSLAPSKSDNSKCNRGHTIVRRMTMEVSHEIAKDRFKSWVSWDPKVKPHFIASLPELELEGRCTFVFVKILACKITCSLCEYENISIIIGCISFRKDNEISVNRTIQHLQFLDKVPKMMKHPFNSIKQFNPQEAASQKQPSLLSLKQGSGDYNIDAISFKITDHDEWHRAITPYLTDVEIEKLNSHSYYLASLHKILSDKNMLETATNGRKKYPQVRSELLDSTANSIGAGLESFKTTIELTLERLAKHLREQNHRQNRSMTEEMALSSPEKQMDSFCSISTKLSKPSEPLPVLSTVKIPKKHIRSHTHQVAPMIQRFTPLPEHSTPVCKDHNSRPSIHTRRFSTPDTIEKARPYHYNHADLPSSLRNRISSDPANYNKIVADSFPQSNLSQHPSINKNSVLPDSRMILDAPSIEITSVPNIRPQPRITTTFGSDNVKPKINSHHRVLSDDDGLATLPSPATGAEDNQVPDSSTDSSKSSSVTFSTHMACNDSRAKTSKGFKDPQCQIDSQSQIKKSEDHSLQQSFVNLGLEETSENISHYLIIKTIGKGSFSEVKLALDLNTNERVAIKMISIKGIQDSERLKTCVSREVELLKFMDHPNIVRLIDTVDTPTHLCLVVEYISGGELFDYVNDHFEETTEDDAKPIFLQLLDVVAYLHDNNIVHRDLKPENILLTERQPCSTRPIIKLTDFGLAKFIDPQSPNLTTRCGSEEYAAPEIILGRPYDGRKTDIWALGIILYALLSGSLPFNMEVGQKRRHFFSKIVQANYEFPDPRHETGRRSKISQEGKDLVRMILQVNPKKRATLNQIREHPWLAGVVI
ncbi:hypothetical protein G9A89_019401 [Geosiphon pyriformis]|nr:hypothetical protein G9A89_019401 [Geosiphon pyriformis]